VISDDHRHDRALTPFIISAAIHGLTTIAHHCSILITIWVEGNVSLVLWTLRRGTGLPFGKLRKSRNPGGRIGRMERIRAVSRMPLGGITRSASFILILWNLTIFDHRDHGRTDNRGCS
jgi:hypothetical protein